MTKNLSWRLSKLPTPDEVRELVKDKIITQEEARSILFKDETTEERDIDSFKAEIKFLREIVERLSKDRNQVSTIIYEYHQPYKKWNWYAPYMTWGDCGTITNADVTLLGGGGTTYKSNVLTSNTSFSSISTF